MPSVAVNNKQKEIDALIKQLQQLQNNSPQKTDEIGEVLLNIARIYDGEGRYENAIDFYKQAFESFKRFLTAPPPVPALVSKNSKNKPTLPAIDQGKLAAIANHIGEAWKNQGNEDEALKHFRQSYEIKKKFLSSDHQEIIAASDNIGRIYKAQGKFNEALRFFRDEKEIEECKNELRKQEVSLKKEDVIFEAPNPESTGNTDSLQSDDIETSLENQLEKHKMKLDYLNKICPDNKIEIASALFSTGNTYDAQEQYEQALDYYNQSFEICKQALPEDHANTAIVLRNTGLVYKKLKKYNKALKYLNQSLEIYKKTLPPDHSDITNLVNSIEECNNEILKIEENKKRELKEKAPKPIPPPPPPPPKPKSKICNIL